MNNFIEPVELDILLDEVPTAATGLITSDETQPDADGTITIGGHVYTFKSSLTGAVDEVSLDNLKAAVNAAAGAGTTYSSATVANPDVTATTNTDTTQLFVANEEGIDGNSLASTEDGANIEFAATTFAGGTDETEANDQATAGEVSSHTVTITAVAEGFSGNAVIFTENATTRTAVDIVVKPTDKVQLLASAGVENNDAVKVHLR